MIELEACMATQSWVNRKHRRGLSTHPCGGPCVKDQRSGDVVSYLHHLGAARQEVQHPIAQGVVQNHGLKLNDGLGGNYFVEC